VAALNEVWRYPTAGSIDISSPAITNGIAYVGSQDRRLHALDAVTGDFKWSYATGGNIYASPAMAHRTVYMGSDDKRPYALDASLGAPEWIYNTGRSISSSP
jgi:outer membrane protein assembly factor BamB